MKYPSVTEVLGKYTDWSAVNPDVLDAAAERGKAVHRYCALYAQELFAIEPQGCEGYCESFRRWFDDMVSTVHLVEFEAIDHTYGFVGHPDLLGALKGDELDTIVIDWKTPAAAAPMWRAQLAAYKHLTGSQRCASVRLRKDGKPALFTEYTDTHADFQAFLSALYAHKFFIERRK